MPPAPPRKARGCRRGQRRRPVAQVGLSAMRVCYAQGVAAMHTSLLPFVSALPARARGTSR
eukprot:12913971-Prorocentrum_lima.AAC.1